MADIKQLNAAGVLVKYVDNLDGSFSEFVSTSGGGGGGGGSGSITLPGVSGTSAQAVQGITGGVPLSVSSSDLGNVGDAAATTDTGTFSLVALVKRALQNWTALLARLPAALTGIPNADQSAQPMRLVGQNASGAGFSAVGASVLDTFFVQTPIVTGGVTYNQAAGALNVVAGTTINAEFLARSVSPYRGSMRKRFSLVASQRIVNNNFAVLLADLIGENLSFTINSATSVTVNVPGNTFDSTMVGQFVNLGGIVSAAAAVPGRYAIASVVTGTSITFTVAGFPASGSGTCTLFGRNYVRHLVTGATATTLNVDAQRNGWASGDTAAAINTTASPGTVIQAELTGREVFFSDALRASSTAPNFNTRASRYENIPDQGVDLYVFLWNFNGTVAPASSSTFTLAHLSVENFVNLPVYLQGARSLGQQNALPVQLQAGANAVGSVTIGSGTVTTLTTLTGGGAAEDAAAGTNPLTVGGVVRTAMAPTTLVAGDAARLTMTAGAAAVISPYSVPDVSWQTPAPVGGILNTTTAFQLKEAAGALLSNYLTGMDLYAEAVTNATDLRIREPDLTCASQTIASNTLTTSAVHNLRIGDAVVSTASTVTGLTAGVSYFVLTVPSTTTLTLSATRGGSVLAISGSAVTATFHKVLWQARIPTAGSAPRYIEFPVPLRGSVNTAMQIQTATASGAGAVYASVQGFAAP